MKLFSLQFHVKPPQIQQLSDFGYIEEKMCRYHQKLPVPQGRIRKYEDFSAKIDFDPMCRGT